MRGGRTARSGKTGRSGRTGTGRAGVDATRARTDGAPAIGEPSAAEENETHESRDARGGDASAPASGIAAPVLPAFREHRVSKLHGKKGGQPFIVLTGLSGSGKSQAIRALEDLGYFCVDNLPTTLIPMLAKLSLRAGGDIGKVAIVVDVREGGFLSSFPKVFKKLRAMPRLNPILIFLEASHDTLVRRFSETRRPHPLAADRPVSE